MYDRDMLMNAGIGANLKLMNSLSAAPRPVPKSVWGVLDLDEKREAALKFLGERWLLHPKHSPQKGIYDPWRKG